MGFPGCDLGIDLCWYPRAAAKGNSPLRALAPPRMYPEDCLKIFGEASRFVLAESNTLYYNIILYCNKIYYILLILQHF